MSSARHATPGTGAPTIPAAGEDESAAPALVDDPATNDAAWASWARHLIWATAVSLPVLTVLIGSAFVAFTDASPAASYAIAFFASLWMCVFVGGAVGTTLYEVRHGHD